MGSRGFGAAQEEVVVAQGRTSPADIEKWLAQILRDVKDVHIPSAGSKN